MEQLARGQRRSLPTRRLGYTQKIRVSDQPIYIRTGEYEDGSLGEIFLDVNLTGSSMRAMINALAISMSLGLQYGAPLEAYVKVFKDFSFIPNGPVQGDERFEETASILDYLVRELEATYLRKKDGQKENQEGCPSNTGGEGAPGEEHPSDMVGGQTSES